jgi:uncharacterized protein
MSARVETQMGGLVRKGGALIRPIPHCRSALLALALFALPACGPRGDDAGSDEFIPLIRFSNAPARIVTDSDTIHITVDVAEREDQRAYGLMERTQLGADEGMIFLYSEEQPADAGFWMYRTRIPLDIAFYHEDGRIVRILQMEPCPSVDPRGCRSYPPGVPYYGALEMNRGFFASRGVSEGARIVLDR